MVDDEDLDVDIIDDDEEDENGNDEELWLFFIVILNYLFHLELFELDWVSFLPLFHNNPNSIHI